MSSEGRTPFFATLPDATNVRASCYDDSVTVEADQLGESQARLNGEQQQGKVATPNPCRSIRCCKERFYLRSGQELNEFLVVPLTGYREYALDMGAVCWLLEGGEAERRNGSRSSEGCACVRILNGVSRDLRGTH